MTPFDPNGTILPRLIRAEASAFDAVYDHFRPRVFSFLARLGGSRAVAEELTQETFLRLARNATSLRLDTRLAAWLFTVARNLHRDHRRRLLLHEDRLDTIAHWPGMARVAPSPLDLAEADEGRRRLETALAQLPPPQREAVLLVAIEGFSPADAARVANLPPATLRKRLSRGRELLRRLLDEVEDAATPARPLSLHEEPST